jgi:PleD family two-component response regulator
VDATAKKPIWHADQAMYHAKPAGRNTHVVFRNDPAA